MTTIVETALAKLNLYLHVTGRRADGYHILDSLVAFASVGDALTVTEDPKGPILVVDGPFARAVPPNTDNLAMRALAQVCAATHHPPALRVHLTKRLPVAAGIGGGSADAAAMLRALGRLWDLPPALLADTAPMLGADVPVCLTLAAQTVAGIGEQVAKAPTLPAIGLVLANPGVPVATPDVFKARSGPFSAPAPLHEAPADAEALVTALTQRRNDLTPAASRICPQIQEVLAEIAVTEGCLLARMSGSGATCFGLYETVQAADQAVAPIQAEHPDWWVCSAKLWA